MYLGHVNVSSDKLPAVLNTADALQIKGLEKTNELAAENVALKAAVDELSGDNVALEARCKVREDIDMMIESRGDYTAHLDKLLEELR